MKRNLVTFFLYGILTILISPVLFANVEVFSNYDTYFNVTSNDRVEVTKNLTLKNVYDRGIVPGQIEFKIAEGVGGSVNQIQVENVRAYDSFGSEISSQVRTTDEHTVIILDIFYPLLPGFEYDFIFEYELTYGPGGIFFKSLQIPIRESTIPIQNGMFSVELPSNTYFTYLDSDEGEGYLENGIAKWDIDSQHPNTVSFEYSYIPIRMGQVRGSHLFWIFVNVLLFLFVIYEIRKQIKLRKEENQ